MLFSIVAFPAIEQVAPSSPAETIPAQNTVEQVTPTNPASWFSYNPVPQGGYLIASTPDALCSAAKVAFIASTADEYTYTFSGSMTYIPNWNAYYCFSVLTWVNGKNYYPSGSPYYASLYSAASCPVASPAYQYNDLTGLCERTIPCPPATPPYTLIPATNRCERPAVCPTPTIYPDIPYTYNPVSLMCERTLPETYTLTLTPETATIEPGKTVTFTATVTKQGGGAPSLPIPVSVKVEVDPTSGGHDHGDSTRPKGSVSPASGNTVLTATFTASEVSGTHTLTARCDLCVNKTEQASVDVKVEGLKPISGSPFYVFVGATNEHSDNHYLTPEAEAVLKSMAVAYQFESRFKIDGVTPPPLHLNDASLVWGGRFDVKGNWSDPHAGHRRGVVIDVRANSAEGAIPLVSFDNFKKTALDTDGAKAKVHCSKDRRDATVKHKRQPPACISQADGSQDNNRHFHILLLGVDQ